MTETFTPDPAAVGATRRITIDRSPHYFSGEAVAVVARGGEWVKVPIDDAYWLNLDDSGDAIAAVACRTEYPHKPFVAFAGVWADAKSRLQENSDIDWELTLDNVWGENAFPGGATARYEARVQKLSAIASEMGLSPVGHVWEDDWIEELESLWPAVCEVAAMLIEDKRVTHHEVLGAIQRCRREDLGEAAR